MKNYIYYFLSILLILSITLLGCFTGKKSQMTERQSKYKQPTKEFIDSLKTQIYGTTNKGLRKYSIDISSIDFKSYEPINSNNFKSSYFPMWNLSGHDEFVLEKQNNSKDELCMKYYLQFHKGYLVEGTHFRIDSLKGKLVKTSGVLMPDLDVDTAGINITLDEAVKVILDTLKPAWHKLSEKVMIISEGKLIYRIGVTQSAPYDSFRAYVSPYSGRILSLFSTLNHFSNDQKNENGNYAIKKTLQDCPCGISQIISDTVSVSTFYHGTQAISISECTDSIGSYTLKGSLPNQPIYLLDKLEAILTNNTMIDTISWCDNNIINPSRMDSIEATAYYSLEASYNYFKQKVNIESYDDLGSEVIVYVHEPKDFNPNTMAYTTGNAASWNQMAKEMVLGDGEIGECNPIVSIDIVAHEYSHAVLNSYYNINSVAMSIADLNDTLFYNTKALHESVSDILSVLIRYREDNSFVDWSVGDIACFANPELPRYLDNPLNSSRVQAAYYEDSLYSWSFDPTEIYNRAGVISYWFYLLSQGGTGVKGEVVNSIGIDDAELILLTTLGNIKQSPDTVRRYNFEQFRDFSIEAVTTLSQFGTCSFEHEQLVNAWKAVGLIPCALDVNIARTETGENCAPILTAELSGGSGCYSYQWSILTNGIWIPVLGGTSNNIQALCPNQYKVVVQDIFLTGCSDDEIIIVNPLSNEAIINIKNVQIYPNPVNDLLTIEIETTKSTSISIELVDNIGRTIKLLGSNKHILGKKLISIKMDNLASGMYYIALKSANKVEAYPIVKE